MASIPLVALQYRNPEQPDFVRQQAEAVALRNAQQQAQYQRQLQPIELQRQQQAAQLGQQEMQQRQLQMHQAQVTQQLLPQFATRDESGKVTGYDYDSYFNALRQNGVDPTPIQEKHQEYLSSVQKYKTAELAQQSAALDKAFQQLEGIKQIQDPQQRQAAYQQTVMEARQNGLHGADQFPAQVPDNEGLAVLEGLGGMHAQALKETEVKADINKKNADARKADFEAQFGTGDIGQYTANYLAAHKLENTPENRLKAHAAFTQETKVNPAAVRANVWLEQPRQIVIGQDGQPRYANALEINAANKAGQPLAPAQYSPEANIERQTGRAFGPGGKGSEEVLAFQTADQHAQLLQQAANQLNNGNVRAANDLGNKLGIQFGSDKATNFRAIANAYTREVTKALSAGHLTDAEIAQQGATLPDNASPAQIAGTLKAYRNLMQSKINLRKQQFEAGKQGKVAFDEQPNQQPSTSFDWNAHPKVNQ